MRSHQNRLLPLATIFVGLSAAVLLLSSCGADTTAPSETSTLRLMLRDAPMDDVEEVNIYFTSVTVKPVGRGVEQLDLELDENPIDLLTLEDRVIAFATGIVPEGNYEFIHINIDQSRSFLIVDGQPVDLRVPSQEIKILQGFTVDDDEETIVLDFDARASLVPLGNGDWLLKPSVVVDDDEM
jgi:hypothetical protein